MADGSHPFLDRALEAYRGAVKAWSRDTLLVALALVAAGVFIVAPYLRLDRLRVEIEADRVQAQAELHDLTTALEELTAATTAIEDAQGQLQETSDRIADELSGELRRIAHLANRLRDVAPPEVPDGGPLGAGPGEPLPFVQQRAPLPEGQWPAQAPASRPTFPSPVRVEQWQAPPDFPGTPLPPDASWARNETLSPEAALRDFGLDDTAIEQLRLAFENGPGSPEWAAASSLGEAVFRRRIEAAYDELERAVATEIDALVRRLDARFEQVAPLQEPLGITLPATAELLPKAAVVRLPPDDRPFRSVAGKAEAFGSVGLYEVQLDLEAASAPIRASTETLAETRQSLDEKRLALETREQETETALAAIEARLATIAEEAGSLGAPLKWLALDTGLFAHLYPALVALALLWLAVRKARLGALETRLRHDYSETGVADLDIDLALYVPDAMLGGRPARRAHTGSRWLLALATAGVLGLVVAWIATSGQEVWLWQLPALLLGLAACLAILRPNLLASLGR